MAFRQAALAGMVSDTSLYNIDGACVLGGSDQVQVGQAVGVSEVEVTGTSSSGAGHKTVVGSGITTANVYGVTVRSHYEAADGFYRPQEAINVMTAGRIWMKTTLSAAPAFGSAITLDATGIVVSGGAVEPVGWTFAGGFISGTTVTGQPAPYDGALIEVQVKQK